MLLAQLTIHIYFASNLCSPASQSFPPQVLIWSAVACSSAFPFLYVPQQLLARDSRGQVVPFSAQVSRTKCPCKRRDEWQRIRQQRMPVGWHGGRRNYPCIDACK